MDEDLLHELFASLAPVRITRMFGGQGIYSDGMIVAVVVAGELMMKADAECAEAFEASGARQWRYAREAREPVRMPYWSLPDEAYDDPSAMADYAALSMGAARRSQVNTPAPRSARKKPEKGFARKPET